MKIPNNFFVFFFLFFASNSSFAQFQKGDVWLDFSPQNFQQESETIFLGSSNVGFASNISTLQSRMGYGKFIGNNSLLGFKLDGNADIARSLFFFNDRARKLDVGLFFKRYFGQKSLRPFAETSFNTELDIGGGVFQALSFRNSEYFNWKIGGGLAYFLNKNTSLEFSYNFKPIALRLNSSQLFSEKLTPNFGIALRYFILKNRDGVQNLNANKTLEEGTLSVNLDSDFLIGKRQRLRKLGLSVEYFIRKNFQLKTEFGLEKKTFLFEFTDATGEQISENLDDIRNKCYGGLSGLYFFKINKNLSIDTGVGAKFTRSPNIGLSFVTDSEEDIKLFEDELSLRIGLSFYLGRHLLRPHFIFFQHSFDSDAPNEELIYFDNFSLNLDYELFLAENLSMNLGMSYLHDYQWVEPEHPNFTLLQLSQKTSDILRINFAFKWYLRRGKES